jgi:hypothetical protein
MEYEILLVEVELLFINEAAGIMIGCERLFERLVKKREESFSREGFIGEIIEIFKEDKDEFGNSELD